MPDPRHETEKDFMAVIAHLARMNGWKVFHVHDSRRSEPGYPDLTLLRGHRLVLAELKTLTGRVTKAQADWLRALGKAQHVEACLWRPSDFPAIERLLQREA